MTDPSATAIAVTVLCVDDEANILAALKRLFRPAGYRLLTAGSGAEGLALLEQEQGQVDLVISDMRMPEMDGARFLAQVRQRWPDTARILLTGYADMESTVAAINEGRISRYISKPWNDSELLLTVREVLERRMLEKEKQRLENLTRQQNDELIALNAGLEATVAKRTAELQQAHDRIKRSFFTSVQVFANLIELRGGAMAGHAGRVADLSRKVAGQMGLNEKECQDIFLAALLHDIGKIGLPDELLSKPPTQMSGDEFALWRRHPIKGEQALMSLEALVDVASIIRGHHERFDGSGYPDGLSGMTIPLGARILAVANEYDGLVQGGLTGKRLSDVEAQQFILRGKGKRYDPSVVDVFLGLGGNPEQITVADREVSTHELRPGMSLARDVVNREGVVLLTANYVLTEHLIRQLKDFERTEGTRLVLFVNAEGSQT
ncbi:MAG: response regulator [Rhodocyclaceae bacterium]|nr:MAG: response regulator [Rhodocyclaceae bacterium]